MYLRFILPPEFLRFNDNNMLPNDPIFGSAFDHSSFNL